MEKSLQEQLWVHGSILMNKLSQIRLFIQNDLNQMIDDKQITKEQILDAVHDLEKQYQWLYMDLRSWTTQMKAYMRFVANGNKESDIKDEVPKTGALFDRLIIKDSGKSKESLEIYLETHLDNAPQDIEKELAVQFDDFVSDEASPITDLDDTGDFPDINEDDTEKW